VECERVLGIHYNTFGYIAIDTEEALNKFKAAGKTLLLPQIGDAVEV
jgi:hypothetical protein